MIQLDYSVAKEITKHMPRTWDNQKIPKGADRTFTSVSRVANARIFTVLIIIVGLFFGGLVFYTFGHVMLHPLKEAPMAAKDQPKDD